MKEYMQFYINGQWVDLVELGKIWDVINFVIEELCGWIVMGSKVDVDKVVVVVCNVFLSYL